MSVTSFNVASEADWDTAMTSIAGGTGGYAVTLTAGFTLSSDPLAINLGSGGTLSIDGGGFVIDGASTWRGLFVYAGQVSINNLGVSDTIARGGAGGYGTFVLSPASKSPFVREIFGYGGGGGAGLGGGLFVASRGTVSLGNVLFTKDAAVGGHGGGSGFTGTYANAGNGGGGGGMGGAGGSLASNAMGGGGGGGIGAGAVGAINGTGGGSAIGGAGIVPGAGYAGSGYVGTGMVYATPAAGKGGGGGYDGGGGGIDGGSVFVSGSGIVATGAGGFGGGGPGAHYYAAFDPGHVLAHGGAGGFGGGGGGGSLAFKSVGNVTATFKGGAGGFGGGGAGGGGGGAGGFGAASGLSNQGGGGLGAGADVFVQQGGLLSIGAGLLGAGTVAGGLGGVTVITNPGYSPIAETGAAGSGLGSGLFIQGNQTVRLTPAHGQFLTITGNIADQSGNGGSGMNAGSGALAIAALGAGGGGTVLLNAGIANSFTGGTMIGAGSTLEVGVLTTAGSGPISLDGAGSLVRFDGVGDPANMIKGFDASTTIDLAGLPFAPGGGRAQAAGGSLAITEKGVTQTLLIPGLAADAPFVLGPDGGTGTSVTIACFAAGTRIRTDVGETEVGSLTARNLVLNASGVARPIAWIGHRRIRCHQHHKPHSVWPVRVSAGAFGTDQPLRDLWLSPDHAVFIDRVLIPIRCLINGRTIVQEQVDEVSYYHVELATHDVILAEGLPCESYLETGNRDAFANGGPVVMVQPDFAVRVWEAKAHAELVVTGAELDAARKVLLATAEALGHGQPSSEQVVSLARRKGMSLRVRSVSAICAFDSEFV